MAVFLFAMMTITAVDVLGRYVFNTPVPGGFEIVQYLMAVVVFASLPLTTAAERHLTVSLLENRFSGMTSARLSHRHAARLRVALVHHRLAHGRAGGRAGTLASKSPAFCNCRWRRSHGR